MNAEQLIARQIQTTLNDRICYVVENGDLTESEQNTIFALMNKLLEEWMEMSEERRADVMKNPNGFLDPFPPIAADMTPEGKKLAKPEDAELGDVDNELDHFLMNAARRAKRLSISAERFSELSDAASDVAYSEDETDKAA
jgi:hypothetical protein